MCKRSVGFLLLAVWAGFLCHAGALDVSIAPTTAASEEFSAAISNIIAAGGYGTIYVTTGNYRFNSQVVVDSQNIKLSIQSTNGTAAFNCNNSSGIFKFTSLNAASRLFLKGFTCNALNADSGTAIEISRPGSVYVLSERFVVVRDVKIQPYGGNTPNAFFNKGIRLEGIPWPLFDNVTIKGDTTDSGLSDSSRMFLMDYGIEYSQSYAPDVVNCSIQAAKTGIYFYDLRTSGNNVEGFRLRESAISNCKTGVVAMLTNSDEPALIVSGCSFQCRDSNLQVIKRRHAHVSDCTFNYLSSSYPMTDLYLDQTWSTIIHDNIFNGAYYAGRKNIQLTASCEEVLLTHNDLDNTEANSLQIDSGATTIITRDNY